MSATATITTALHKSVVAVPIQALTARLPKREKPPEMAEGGLPAESEGDEGRSGQRGHPPGAGQDQPGGPGMTARTMAEHGEDEGEFARPEPVEVVFVVARDTTGSGSGFLARLFGTKPSERVEQREVKIGISSDTHYEILAGLEPGEEIVIGNYRAVSKDLRDSSLVTRKERSSPRRQQP
jgi:hypothetical protein